MLLKMLDELNDLADSATLLERPVPAAKARQFHAAQRHDLLIITRRFDHAAPLATSLVAHAARSVTRAPVPCKWAPILCRLGPQKDDEKRHTGHNDNMRHDMRTH